MGAADFIKLIAENGGLLGACGLFVWYLNKKDRRHHELVGNHLHEIATVLRDLSGTLGQLREHCARQ